MLIAFLSFWSIENIGLNQSSRIIVEVFAGGVVPFTLVTGGWKWLIYNPLSFIIHHPMQIYLGNYNAQQILFTFLGGTFWCIVLYLIAKLNFKAGLKRNEAVGL